MTSINYAEDIDSLRFALSVRFDYNILEQRPHFPGYPVFCFLAKVLYTLTQSISVSFSMIGSISIFLIIILSEKIYRLLNFTSSSIFLKFLIFFNPFLWILSNRYMSDLFGLSILMCIIFFLIKYIKNNSRKDLFAGFFILGIAAGVRLSFLPFLFPMLFYLFYKNKQQIHKMTFSLFCGVILWLAPLILITGPENIFNLMINDSYGHFNKWGGTVLSSKMNFSDRLISTIESIWADGMSGYWPGRHWITIIISLSYIFLIIKSIHYVRLVETKNVHILLILSVICYFVWAFLFQNVAYKPRHIIPVLPFIFMIINIGFSAINKKQKYFIFLFSVISLITISINLTSHHQNKKTAINQMKDYVVNRNIEKKAFYSSRLISDYVKAHQSHFGTLESYEIYNRDIVRQKYIDGYVIFSTENLDTTFFQKVKTINFFHNPYVNRLWSKVVLNIYSTKPIK